MSACPSNREIKGTTSSQGRAGSDLLINCSERTEWEQPFLWGREGTRGGWRSSAKRRFPSPKTCVNTQTNPFLIRLCVRVEVMWMAKADSSQAWCIKTQVGVKSSHHPTPASCLAMSHCWDTGVGAGHCPEAGLHAACPRPPQAAACMQHCSPRTQRVSSAPLGLVCLGGQLVHCCSNGRWQGLYWSTSSAPARPSPCTLLDLAPASSALQWSTGFCRAPSHQTALGSCPLLVSLSLCW